MIGIKHENIFQLALFLYVLQFYLQKSIYSEFSGYRYINYVFRLTILGLLMLKIIIGRMNKRTFFMLVLLSIVALIIYFKSGYFEVPVAVLFIFSAKGINFEKLLNKLLLYHVMCFLFIFSSYILGILEDYKYSHDGVWAHSWGFLYYSNPAFSMMTITILYVLVRKNIKKIEYLLIAGLNYLFYLGNTTKLTFIVTIVFLMSDFIICLYTKKSRRELPLHKIRKVSVLIPEICIGFNLYLIYSSLHQGIFSIPKNIISSVISRVDYSILAIQHYGFSLFGNKIQMVGSYMVHYGGAREVGTNYYIDSGYLYTLLGYGLVFSVLLLIVYGFLFYYLCSTKKIRLFLWLDIICIASIGNGLLLDVIFNPILLLTPFAMAYSKNMSKKMGMIRRISKKSTKLLTVGGE